MSKNVNEAEVKGVKDAEVTTVKKAKVTNAKVKVAKFEEETASVNEKSTEEKVEKQVEKKVKSEKKDRSKAKKVAKKTLQIVSICVAVCIIAVCGLVGFKLLQIKGLADDYFELYLHAPYDKDADTYVDAKVLETNDSMEDYYFEYEDGIIAEVKKTYELGEIANGFKSLKEYVDESKVKDIERLKYLDSVVKNDGKNHEYLKAAIEKLEGGVTEYYGYITTGTYASKLDMVCMLLGGEKYIDERLAELSDVETTVVDESSSIVGYNGFTLKEVINEIVNKDTELYNKAVEVSDKLDLLIKKETALVFTSDTPIEVYNAITDNVSYVTDAEFDIVRNIENCELKVQLISAYGTAELEDITNELAEKAVFESEFATDVVDKIMISSYISNKNYETVRIVGNNNPVFDNLRNYALLNIICGGGSLTELGSETGIEVYDFRTGLGYVITYTNNAGNKLSDKELKDTSLWCHGFDAAMNNVNAKAESDESAASLMEAVTLYMQEITYNAGSY